jgi:hypothetical protein
VFTPPSVQGLIDNIGNNNEYYKSIDLRQGYHNIPLKGNNREKTILSSGGLTGKLPHHVLPDGFKHGGQVFLKTIKRILGRLLNKSCPVYVNAILIFSETFDLLPLNRNHIIGPISSKGGGIDLGSSKFLAEEIDFLGHIIGAKGLMATEKDISAIEMYKGPTSKKNVEHSLP